MLRDFGVQDMLVVHHWNIGLYGTRWTPRLITAPLWCLCRSRKLFERDRGVGSNVCPIHDVSEILIRSVIGLLSLLSCIGRDVFSGNFTFRQGLDQLLLLQICVLKLMELSLNFQVSIALISLLADHRRLRWVILGIEISNCPAITTSLSEDSRIEDCRVVGVSLMTDSGWISEALVRSFS